MKINNLSTNIFVTILMFVMVIFMPMIDRMVCKAIGISPDDRMNKNPHADFYLHLRKAVLVLVFLIYLALLSYVVFFSRSASGDYLIHIALYEDLANAIQIDFGILGFINSVFTDGLSAALEHVRVNKIEDVYQVYLNIALFVPMGYLLPYVFDFFRGHMPERTLIACGTISFLIENIQLVTKLGFYDIDDMISNMIGGALGQLFYMHFAYVLAHPDFRKELKRMRRHYFRAKDLPLYSYLNKIRLQRVTVYASDKKEVFDFYEKTLGFRLKRLIPEGDDSNFLFEFGKNQIEVRCSERYKDMPKQEITIACNNSEFLKQTLAEHHIETSEYLADPYTELRTFCFKGPDDLTITIIEE